jgi:hypothetical protein
VSASHSPQIPPRGPTTKQEFESHCGSRSHAEPFGRPPGSPVDPSEEPPEDPELDSVLAAVLEDSSTVPELDSVPEVLGSPVGPELLLSAVVALVEVEPVSAEVPDVGAPPEDSAVVASDTVDVDPESEAVAATPSSEQPTSHATHTTQLR